jgi:hypothetical protein
LYADTASAYSLSGREKALLRLRGINELLIFLEGNTPSFIEQIIILSKSRHLVSRTPITCNPARGSPLKGTEVEFTNCLSNLRYVLKDIGMLKSLILTISV